MKGLVLLFLMVVFGAAAWRYCAPSSRETFKRIVSENLLAVVLASLAVALAIFVSTNTTMRLV